MSPAEFKSELKVFWIQSAELITLTVVGGWKCPFSQNFTAIFHPKWDKTCFYPR